MYVCTNCLHHSTIKSRGIKSRGIKSRGLGLLKNPPQVRHQKNYIARF